MLKALSNNGAGLHKELGLLICMVAFIGCSVIEIPAPKQWDCEYSENSEVSPWYCRAIGSDKCIYSEIVEPERCGHINGTSLNGTNSTDN